MRTVTVYLVINCVICFLHISTADMEDECSPGWFGKKCQYKCRCTSNKCDRDGNCILPSKCQKYWFGPACQYYDLIALATVKPPYLNNILTNVSVCNNWNSLMNVTVTWRVAVPFTWLRLQVKKYNIFEYFNIIFANNDEVMCGDAVRSIIDPKTLDIHCPQGILINSVTLKGRGVTELCNLYISGGRNVAIKQQTSQSSTYTDNELPENVTISEKAVDGNTSGDIKNHKSCTHTKNEKKPYWELILSSTKLINMYFIYNRGTHEDRLKGFHLTSSNDKGETVFYYTDNETGARDMYWIVGDVDQHIHKIRISLAINGILTLCEVEAQGDSVCSVGFYGRDCENPCKCAKNEGCFVSTGACPSGCSAGFYGEGCQKECDPMFYGVGCKENCNKDCTNSLCHHVTGACKDCPPGRTGEACERNCTLGTYGNNCSQRCSEHCKGNQGCNNLNGECSEGCNSGYRGSYCNTTCETLKYGENCKSNCSQFCVVDASMNPSVCHHETGECRLGCVSDYEGLQCIQLKSTSAETGVNAGAVAGPIIVVLLLIIAVVIGLFVWRRRKRTKRSNVLDNGSLGNLTDFSLSGSHSINAGNNGSVKPAKFSVDKPPLYPSISDNATTGEKRDEVYNNIIPGPSKTVIAVGDLNTFMLSHSKEYFAEEFKKIPSPSNISMSIGQSAENKNKNRYKNICAYDHSRVKLISNGEKGQGDYINASYIQGYDNKETFIASQGPSKVIIEDFIRMLWEQKCNVVVMLTNLIEDAKQKCEKYWPDENELMFGEIKIRLIDSQVLSDCVIRKLQLSKANLSTHTLTQFHFTAWPDKGVPTNPWSLVDFEHRVASCRTTRPVVVHCSAGVGRTGTFIALQNVMMQAKDTGFMDFYSTLLKLRQERVSMIQTVEQYVFLHEAAQIAMACIEKTVTANDVFHKVRDLEEISASGQSYIEQEFKAVCNVCTSGSDGTDDEGSGGSSTGIYLNSRTMANKQKNRFSNVLPKEQHRPHLFCETKDMGEYINAVLLSSLTTANSHILTQLPLPTTVHDFWRLVMQFNVSLIVAFEVDADDSTVGVYLPSGSTGTMHCEPFDIETKSTTSTLLWEEKMFSVTRQKRRKSGLSLTSSIQRAEIRQVTHLKCAKRDFTPEDLLVVVQRVRSISPRDKTKVVYMCRNGADYSGLSYVLSQLLDRMDTDHELMVPLVVGSVKNVRPQVIPTLDQYRTLYQVLMLHAETFSTYNNWEDNRSQTGDGTGISNLAFDTAESEDINVYANT